MCRPPTPVLLLPRVENGKTVTESGSGAVSPLTECKKNGSPSTGALHSGCYIDPPSPFLPCLASLFPTLPCNLAAVSFSSTRAPAPPPTFETFKSAFSAAFSCNSPSRSPGSVPPPSPGGSFWHHRVQRISTPRDAMVRAFVACGAALITIGHMYIFNVLPFMVDAGVPTEEVEAFTFLMFLVILFGLVLAQLGCVLPRVDVVVERREDAEAAAIVAAAAEAVAEEEEQEQQQQEDKEEEGAYPTKKGKKED